jgi:hypothetical protein
MPGVPLVVNPPKFQDVTPSSFTTLNRSEDEGTNDDMTEAPRRSTRDDTIAELPNTKIRSNLQLRLSDEWCDWVNRTALICGRTEWGQMESDHVTFGDWGTDDCFRVSVS